MEIFIDFVFSLDHPDAFGGYGVSISLEFFCRGFNQRSIRWKSDGGNPMVADLPVPCQVERIDFFTLMIGTLDVRTLYPLTLNESWQLNDVSERWCPCVAHARDTARTGDLIGASKVVWLSSRRFRY
ncbi:multidrug resistance protein 4 [Plakobranchus ocellatus]|uniref:Multidrug resistance protein 4 n=1 Tax=Plakobranchus ocellatus TaxID=259542 RepID=A0AAV4BCV9_9GAST|nr:multidrug resistance protein 4 [Plakobranchus ocellatus]